MRIILSRHARSLGQAHSGNYAKYGDSRVPLDPGHAHLAIKCGEFLSEYFNQTATKKWPLVWTSQFTRAQQTWGGYRQGIGDYFGAAQPTWHIDPRLNEQSFGALPYLDDIKNPMRRFLAKSFAKVSQALYVNDPFSSSPLMGEAPRQTLINVQNFIDGSFTRDAVEGIDDVLIISHGAVMKAFIMNWFHLYDLDTWKALDTPGNCDVYVIEGEPKDWSVRKIYDGETATGLLDNPINPIAHITKPTDFNPPPLILPQ